MLMAWKRLSSDNYTLGHNKPNFFTIYFSLGNKTQKTALEYPCSVVNGVILRVNRIPCVHILGHKVLYSWRPHGFVFDIAGLSSVINENRTKFQLCSTWAPVRPVRWAWRVLALGSRGLGSTLPLSFMSYMALGKSVELPELRIFYL